MADLKQEINELGEKINEFFKARKITSELKELQNGSCEVCGVKVNDDFVFGGVCSVEGKISVIGHGILEFISFCDKECRKEARKLAKLKVKGYNDKSFSPLKDPKKQEEIN
ncbi:10316_t:CDS:2 [Funneliformis geosporum]|nr:10316_t:CDS:2 [Funneliformis geosporum]